MHGEGASAPGVCRFCGIGVARGGRGQHERSCGALLLGVLCLD